MRVLWVSINCLLDSSSGASLAIESMLKKMIQLGWNVEAIGCTTFDSLSSIDIKMEIALNKISEKSIFEIENYGLRHTLIKTSNYLPNAISYEEINGFFGLYLNKLARFNPDIVFYYGGGAIDLLIPIEAKKYNAKSACYIANSKYIHNSRWADDISLIITDTKSTSQLYKNKINLDIFPVGSMIEKEKVLAHQHRRENVLFINPSPHKGGRLVAQLAIYMMDRRPDIIFKIVDSTTTWSQSFNYVLLKKNINLKNLSNVSLVGNQKDMRHIYERSRILLQPSLYWESGSRVIAEAAINGIPSIVTPVGGQVEMMGDGGLIFDFDEINYQKPYNILLSDDLLKKWADIIINLFDSEKNYNDLSLKALNNSIALHDIDKNILNVTKLFEEV